MCVCRWGARVTAHEGFSLLRTTSFEERTFLMSKQFMESKSPVRDVYEVLLILKGPLLAGLREVRDGASDSIDGVVLLAETMSQALERACDTLERLEKQD